MRARPNAAVQRMMVRNSISRCTTPKISAKKNIMDNRKTTDEVLRYFVVHNFVVNGDSYTGSMIHNY